MFGSWAQFVHRALLGSVALVLGMWPYSVAAQTVTGSASVGVSAVVIDQNVVPTNPSVEFHGVVSPNATVTISRDGTVVSSQLASSTADFVAVLLDQPAGPQNYLISAVDTSGAALAPISFSLTLVVNTNTIITGVFLGPSIRIDKSAVKLGQYVTVAGMTAPSSDVSVTIHSTQAKSFTVTADGSGRWSKLVNTDDVGVGTHTAQARAVLGGSQISAVSAVVSFAVNPLEQCDGKKTADVNCDGHVDLTDFSILLYFWQQTNPRNSRVDINADGRVDVIDFSIMLYQWTN